MIPLMDLTEMRGRRVRQRLPDPTEPVREGVITNVVGRMIVVRFDGMDRSEYTNRDYLEWVSPE